jgi:hypothetical protein
MKKLFSGCLIVLSGALVNVAFGQGPLPPIGFFQNPLALLEAKDVQKDLKLSETQIQKIAELGRKQEAALKALALQAADKRKQALDATVKSLGEILTAEQTRRVRQLELQQRGVNALLDPQVAPYLAITNEQRAAVIKALQGLGPRFTALLQAAKGNQQEAQQKMAELNRGLMPEVLKGLTANQQAKWQELAGPPFAGVFPALVPNGALINPRPQPVLTWIMNDLAAAQAEARKTGKPIFVTIRCEA